MIFSARFVIICGLLMSWGWMNPVPANRVAAWRLGGATPGTTVTENQIDQVASRAAVPLIQGTSTLQYSADAPNGFSGAIDFRNTGTGNNNGSYLSIADAPELTGNAVGMSGFTALSLDVWLKVSEVRQAVILRKTDGNVGYQLYLRPDGRLGFRLEDGSANSSTVLSQSALTADGLWHHVICGWNGSGPPQVWLLLDGERTENLAATVQRLTNTAGPLTIGALYRGATDANPTGQFFSGLIAQVIVSKTGPTFTNMLGMEFATIPAGGFVMGQASGGDWDEVLTHSVTLTQGFRMSISEVTNLQYEQFQAGHSVHRARDGGIFSGDDSPVVYVSWSDAVAFCDWLTQREGIPYRLPTEAEWEYACRAGTTTEFATGGALPGSFDLGPSVVFANPSNPWGLFGMHGNVEEWCADWYGPYVSGAQTDPVGYAAGEFRVTRGGSHSTDATYLRAANRLGALPGELDNVMGFRVVQGSPPGGVGLPAPSAPLVMSGVSQTAPATINDGPDAETPYFAGPKVYVKIPTGANGPLYDDHNHDPALTVCPNGDLLAIWYSTITEQGRMLGIAGSRLRYGASDWDDASVFYDAPDRNDHAPALLTTADGTLFHFNAYGPVTWSNLATVMRKSTANGATWTAASYINRNGGQNGPIDSVIVSSASKIVLPLDWRSGTQLCFGSLAGTGWSSPDRNTAEITYTPGVANSMIWGIHAGVAETAAGGLLALGRLSDDNQNLPMSWSTDGGQNWNYEVSEFPAISYGQRLALRRLKEGPLLLISFTDNKPTDASPIRMTMRDYDGNVIQGFGMYAALSWDDGQTWPLKKLITAKRNADAGEWFDGGAWTGEFLMDARHAEPKGYLSVAQAKNGVIHLISSRLHYQFNLAWLMAGFQIPVELSEFSVE